MNRRDQLWIKGNSVNDSTKPIVIVIVIVKNGLIVSSIKTTQINKNLLAIQLLDAKLLFMHQYLYVLLSQLLLSRLLLSRLLLSQLLLLQLLLLQVPLLRALY